MQFFFNLKLSTLIEWATKTAQLENDVELSDEDEEVDDELMDDSKIDEDLNESPSSPEDEDISKQEQDSNVPIDDEENNSSSNGKHK